MTDEAKILWQLSQSVEAAVSRSFAWSFWTDIGNWSDPPARFLLEGPFAEGARGTTRLPGEPARVWFVREVAAPEGALIEMPLEAATVVFRWRFEALAESRTRMTQTVALRGSTGDPGLLAAVEIFRANLPVGMRKLAEAMASAFARQR